MVSRSAAARRRAPGALAALLAVVVVGGAAPPARAGGFGQPNSVGAAAVGMGGAFAAIADDATAVHHNPAGIALIPQSTFLLDLDFMVPQREYVPAGCSVTGPMLPACPTGATTRRTERELTTTSLLPSVAFTTRFADAGGENASRLGVGLGTFYGYGSSIRFSDKLSVNDRPGVRKLGISLFEIVPAVAYQASDVLAVGAGLRVGIGMFDLDAPYLYSFPLLEGAGGPYNSMTASGNGVGAGGTLGVMVRPRPWLNIAVVYKTELKVAASGNIHIDYRTAASRVDQSLSVNLPFPQQATLGVAVRPLPKLRVSAQLDWTNWATFNKLTLGYSPATTDLLLELKDTWTAHLGAAYLLTPRATVRAGYSLDTGAVPSITADRHLIDGTKHTVGVGGGFAATRWLVVDAAFEYLMMPDKTIAASPAGTPPFAANAAPGTYRASAVQALLTAQLRY